MTTGICYIKLRLCVLVKSFGSAKRNFRNFLNEVIAIGDEELRNVGLVWRGVAGTGGIARVLL